jgi:hypothetical protein
MWCMRWSRNPSACIWLVIQEAALEFLKHEFGSTLKAAIQADVYIARSAIPCIRRTLMGTVSAFEFELRLMNV